METGMALVRKGGNHWLYLIPIGPCLSSAGTEFSQVVSKIARGSGLSTMQGGLSSVLQGGYYSICIYVAIV